MKIFNVMMCRDLGGIQQAFLDYNDALQSNGHEVINITSTKAAIHNFLPNTINLPNLFSWCLISKIYLRILVEKHKPDVIMVHGGRAITFAAAFRNNLVPIIGITHNYAFRRLKKCDYVLAITEDLKQHMINHGYQEDRLYSLPNMIRIRQDFQEKKFRVPIMIGSYGRFVKNKGFHHLLQAVQIIGKRGYDFKLLLGGSGEEEGALRQQVHDLNIEKHVEFLGWIKDKDKFFADIDIFCCPSEHEPFGIVILEAMEYSTPIVATKSQGPSEILTHEQDALLAENQSSEDIAEKLIRLFEDQNLAKNLAHNAYHKLQNQYDIQTVGKRLSDIVTLIKKMSYSSIKKK